MILLGGVPSEGTVAFLADALRELDAEFRVFNQRECRSCTIDLSIDEQGAQGEVNLAGERFALRDFTGAYFRLMDDRLLPELADEPDDSPRRRHTRAFHDTLYRWIEVADARIVNRLDPQGSNGSKPYQAQLITKYGLRTPETLISNDPEEVVAFREKHGKIVYKSMSGVRSIVNVLDDTAMKRLDDIRWCPVQFQEFVPGTDVRVHIVGRDVHATEIRSTATDYRYARQSGAEATLRAVELDGELASRCIAVTEGLGLSFSGIDLRLGPHGEATCFEVNPSPSYAYYESHTGQPIAMSLARLLVGA